MQGVPILFVHSTGIGMELPTEEQRRDAVRQRASYAGFLQQGMRADVPCVWQETRGVVPAHERHALQLEPGAATRVHTNVQFKRNQAKGPNPLSVKKKRPAEAPPAQQGGEVRVFAWHARAARVALTPRGRRRGSASASESARAAQAGLGRRQRSEAGTS